MAAIKLDENVPDSVGATLRQAGHDVHLERDRRRAERSMTASEIRLDVMKWSAPLAMP